MRRFLKGCAFVLMMGLFAPAAEAVPILVPIGEIFGTVVFFDADPTNPTFDVRGESPADVFDFPSFTPIGSGELTGSDPFPANTLQFANAALTESIDLSFDFTSVVFGEDGGFSVIVSGSGSGITDPALTSFLNPNNFALFSFVSVSELLDEQTQERLGDVGTFALDVIVAPEVTAIPEPATLTLLGTGLVVAARRRRAQRANKA